MRGGSYRAGELVDHLYEQDFDRDSNTIEVFVGRLRKKLGVEVIQTMRGLGYLLAAPETKDAVGKPPRASPPPAVDATRPGLTASTKIR